MSTVGCSRCLLVGRYQLQPFLSHCWTCQGEHLHGNHASNLSHFLQFCFHSNTTIGTDHIGVPTNMEVWPVFHNMVAAGLRIMPGLADVSNMYAHIFNLSSFFLSILSLIQLPFKEHKFICLLSICLSVWSSVCCLTSVGQCLLTQYHCMYHCLDWFFYQLRIHDMLRHVVSPDLPYWKCGLCVV